MGACAFQVVQLMRHEIRQPLEFTTSLARRYDDLITSKADHDIDELVERSPSFDEYGQELRRYAAILDDINYNSVRVFRIGMFEVYIRVMVTITVITTDVIIAVLLLLLQQQQQQQRQQKHIQQ